MEFRGSETHTKFKDIFKTPKEADTSALRFKSEQAMLCSQGAELATDCNQCERAKAPWNLEGVKLTLNSKDNLRPQRGGDYPHLDYNKANAKSLFFLRFLCFFIYITHEKR
ncbi:MAG TPA: hypothetical protein OIM33_02385 [Ruminococcus bromii]|nr:hypothetical protein [Ruminococcus bromii]HJI86046.1 hypothetical protein [Ruminococcus bromii]